MAGRDPIKKPSRTYALAKHKTSRLWEAIFLPIAGLAYDSRVESLGAGSRSLQASAAGAQPELAGGETPRLRLPRISRRSLPPSSAINLV
ncbi:hypothetical protein [Peribacillus sp. SCS-37]|uniref:hypothetical protein n=1 Tax=Paraperibacillus esterisolvens TaxID=3115296 RepID=UPI003905D729